MKLKKLSNEPFSLGLFSGRELRQFKLKTSQSSVYIVRPPDKPLPDPSLPNYKEAMRRYKQEQREIPWSADKAVDIDLESCSRCAEDNDEVYWWAMEFSISVLIQEVIISAGPPHRGYSTSGNLFYTNTSSLIIDAKHNE